MNTCKKCNCCLKEDVCCNKKYYEKAKQTILDCVLDFSDSTVVPLRDAKFIEVDIKCPTFLPHSATPRGDMK